MPKRKLRNSIKWGLGIGLAIIIGGVLYLNLNKTTLKPSITWEMGTPITLTANDFFTKVPMGQQAVLVTDMDSIDPMVKGEVKIFLTLDEKTYTSSLVIKDTTAPTAITKNVTLEAGTSVEPSDFIQSISDLDTTEVSFKNTPNFNAVKSVDVVLVVSDASGNKTEVTAIAEVVFDLTPPVITIEKPLYIQVNSTLPDYWLYTTVSDEKSAIKSTTATEMDVNLEKIGVYSVDLNAIDEAGNGYNVVRKVHVVMKSTFLTMQALWNPNNKKAEEYAQAVYDEIITAGMTTRQKMRAVYDYLLEEMTYRSDYSNDYNIDSYNKIDEYALDGFSNLYGNCFYYASMVAILLDKIGMEVTLIKGEGYSASASDHFILHYWILVNVDGNIYHFDPLYEWYYAKTKNPKVFFLVKDAQIYNTTHRWDKSLYPASPK